MSTEAARTQRQRGTAGRAEAAWAEAPDAPSTNGLFLCALAAVVMAYGWGYRGIVGHEGGAMVPGALLGLAVCLGSARLDWHRRAAVAGLFGAVGWAWGGSFSYMEQTFYTVTDSLPDVLYGYACLFLLGALWAGIGGAVLGLAFTLPRSRLERFVGPFMAISVVFLALHIYFLLDYDLRDRLDRYVAQHFHDSDAFPATIVLVVSAAYALVRPRERAEALLFLACSVAWWIGYLGFTKFGGLSLGPPFRNEGWGGVIGILAVLIAYLARQRNRAALMLSLYGIVGGGLAFALAVFVRHPVRVSWGPFAAWDQKMQWKIAEESFGLFMGLAIALGVLRFARDGLAPAEEDAPPKRLDIFAVFVVLVALLWINLRRGPERWIERYDALPVEPVAGLTMWTWFLLGGLLLTALAVYALYLYWKDALHIVPPTAYGKGAVVLLLLLWLTVGGGFAQMLPGAKSEDFPLVDATFIGMAIVVTAMLLSRGDAARRAVVPDGGAPPSDPRWKVGMRYALVWAAVPVVLFAISGLSMAMQDGPADRARLRFGPNAYWREATRVMDAWALAGHAQSVEGTVASAEGAPFQRLEFKRDRSVAVTLPDGRVEGEAHTWQHADSVIWFEWYGGEAEHPEKDRLPLTLREGRLHVPWPPKAAAGYYVFERVGE